MSIPSQLRDAASTRRASPQKITTGKIQEIFVILHRILRNNAAIPTKRVEIIG